MRYFYIFLGRSYLKIYSWTLKMACIENISWKFKQMWYQMYYACLKHFKLVLLILCLGDHMDVWSFFQILLLFILPERYFFVFVSSTFVMLQNMFCSVQLDHWNWKTWWWHYCKSCVEIYCTWIGKVSFYQIFHQNMFIKVESRLLEVCGYFGSYSDACMYTVHTEIEVI